MEQIYRIGIDHGYGNIKTAHHIFESGVIERERASELAGMTVEFEGKFYEIGSTHKEYQMDKVWDEDYYILTLAALAKELKGRGLCSASVILAAGLPIKWLGEQGEGFRKYLLRNKEVTFRCNDIRYHVKIEDVEVYAQGFAAIAENLRDYQGFNIVVDIGNGTMNVIFVVDGVPDSARYYTERFGVDCCVIEMRSELTNRVHSAVDDLIVKKVLKDGKADIGEKYLKAIGECATEYTEKIMRKIREYGYNEELAKLHFLGGGAMLMKHFAKLDKDMLAPIAFSTLAGNRTVSGTCVRYFKYFLSVVMEAVTMALAILICNAFISAGLPSFTGGYADWAQVLIYLCEITFTIALTVGACKGAQSLTGRALGL